jgi:catechol 2,3-dioxygenase-like lactoylglutathione lyase family enzyme
LVFYRDILGLPVRARGEERGGEVARIVGVADLHVRWADLCLPDARVLELIEPVHGSHVDVAPDISTPGATHVALRVTDAQAAYHRLVSAGVPVRSEPVALTGSAGWQGARCFYTTDPDGVTIELIEWSSELRASATALGPGS